MTYLEGVAGQIVWVAKNLAFNLDFVKPAEKLDWKPEPTAKSAYEIAHEVAGALDWMRSALSGGSLEHGKTEPVKTLEGAKVAVVASAEAFAAAIKAVDPADLNKEIDLGFMKAPLYKVVSMAWTETAHHHGQIAYIQTLLGDVESHFDLSSF